MIAIAITVVWCGVCGGRLVCWVLGREGCADVGGTFIGTVFYNVMYECTFGIEVSKFVEACRWM